MFKRFTLLLLGLVVWVGCSEKKLDSGIDYANFDQSVRPQDDFYRYVNGAWLEKTEIPADKSNYGSFTELFDESQANQRRIIEDAAQSGDKAHGSDEQKIGDFYLSYMDSARIEELGLTPLEEDLARIESLNGKEDLAKYFAYARKAGVQSPFVFFVNQDFKNSTEYIGYINQSGLNLPDRDYYLSDNEKFRDIRDKYRTHIEKMFTLAGQNDGAAKAAKILEMETAMAQAHWTRVENRDRNKTYNKFSIDELQAQTPNFNWAAYLETAGIPAQDLVVRQPSYLAAFDQVFSQYSLDDWKTYLNWKLLTAAAEYLPRAFVDEDFDFFSRTLRGIEQNQPRWKRAVNATNGVLGEVVGRLYVAKHFKPEAKARMQKLVENLKLAFAERIKTLEWMSEETQKAALEKLSKFNSKIGYPDEWKDYSQLEINQAELVRNMKRSAMVEYQRMIDKLGQPIDRGEWFMTPQTVNAYYNPPMNEVVFPAAILQPPFFNMDADDAVNYGAIGAVIGHELTHGFDDQGRKSDGDGNLRDWWTESDGEEFTQRADVMVEQYNGFSPIDSMFVNGQLTLGENIADLGGLTIAYNAYQLSLNGKEAPVIDGYTGSQRFFMGWSQVWRRKYREDEMRNRLLTDPHSPSEYRVIGVLSNMPEFYRAFDVKDGDPMYRAEDVRVKIW